MRPWLEKLARELLPPLAIRLARTRPRVYQGDYPSWEAAAAQGAPAEMAGLEWVKSAALKVTRGEAAYERDGWLFDRVQYAWPVLAGLLAAACGEGRLSVLDFGGSLGTTYRQNRRFLSLIPEIEWSIVELPHLVACGREHFEDQVLRFYGTVDECLARRRPNVILLSGVLQYLPDPKTVTRQLLEAPASWCIVDRTLVATGATIITVQVVPPKFGGGSYAVRVANKAEWLDLFPGFTVEAEFDSACDPSRPYQHKGFLLRRQTAATGGRWPPFTRS